MNNKFSFKDTLTIGLMLFALFFGAGNLVFPAMLLTPSSTGSRKDI